jgi:hypothetical protein
MTTNSQLRARRHWSRPSPPSARPPVVLGVAEHTERERQAEVAAADVDAVFTSPIPLDAVDEYVSSDPVWDPPKRSALSRQGGSFDDQA